MPFLIRYEALRNGKVKHDEEMVCEWDLLEQLEIGPIRALGNELVIRITFDPKVRAAETEVEC